MLSASTSAMGSPRPNPAPPNAPSTSHRHLTPVPVTAGDHWERVSDQIVDRGELGRARAGDIAAGHRRPQSARVVRPSLTSERAPRRWSIVCSPKDSAISPFSTSLLERSMRCGPTGRAGRRGDLRRRRRVDVGARSTLRSVARPRRVSLSRRRRRSGALRAARRPSRSPRWRACCCRVCRGWSVTCSGLPVCRHSADDLAATFEPLFTLVAHERERAHHPRGHRSALHLGDSSPIMTVRVRTPH